MARKSKIEEFKLESFIDDLLFENEDMTHIDLAKRCSNKAKAEISKFLVVFREKAFQFELVQEYIGLFMDIFAEESKDGAYERSVIRVAANPRMKHLADQQKLFTGSGE